ncbi:MAG: hypothetical protein H7263_16365, partial [Candidatus Sericytochromatia bacterium]|nr:hypothetical protein [Candidatus Sericytochromatia bacterium]
MEKSSFYLKIQGLDQSENYLKAIIKKLFTKLNNDIEKVIFSEKIIFLTGNNKNIGNIIYETLFGEGVNIVREELISENFNKLGMIIFPLSVKDNVYDVINVFGKISESNTITFDKITNLEKDENLSINIKDGISCKSCYASTPSKLNFCINCGHGFNKNESLSSYSIKITSIDNSNNKTKLVKYLSQVTSIHDYKLLTDYLSRLPTIVNFYMYPSELNNLFKIFDNYTISYSLIDSESFSFEKFFSSFIPYGSLNLGTIQADKSYLDPVISHLAVESIQNSSSDILKNIISKCLLEVYRIIDLVRNSETSSKILFEEIERDVEELLGKFLYFIKRIEQLNQYFSDHSPDKISNEINALKNKLEKTLNNTALEMYKESLNLKEKEYDDLLILNNTIETLQSQIISVMTIFGT